MKILKFCLYTLTFSFLVALRIWGLEKVGLQEYDSVYNFLIIKEITEGNFQNLFHHLSPAFFLFLVGFYQIFPHFLFLESINAVLGAGAVCFFAFWLSEVFAYTFPQKILFCLFVGTSTYGVYGVRSLTIEALGSLLFVGILWAYSEKKWSFFFILIGIMLTVNYKILVFAPLLFFSKHRKTWLQKPLQTAFFLAFPLFFCQILGVTAGVSWKTYPAYWFFVLFGQRKNVNAWHEVSNFSFDLDYYFQYLFFFESPVLLIGLIASVFYLRSAVSPKRLLAVLVVFTFVLMSVLAKAPRGIFWILPILHFFVFDITQNIFSFFTNTPARKFATHALLVGFIFYQFFLLKTHIYDYTATNYPKIAKHLAEKKVKKLVGTVGINVRVFLPQTVDYQVINFEKEIENWANKSYEYCLIDDYHRLVGAEVFDSLRRIKPIAAYREPMLLSPLLYLEHCEFTGMTFGEALHTQKKVAQDSTQIRLIELF